MIEADIVGLGDRHRGQLIVARRANRSSRRAQRHARCCRRAQAPDPRRGSPAAPPGALRLRAPIWLLHARDHQPLARLDLRRMASCCWPAGSRAAARRGGARSMSSVSPCATMIGGAAVPAPVLRRLCGLARMRRALDRAGHLLARGRLIGADAGAAAVGRSRKRRGLDLVRRRGLRGRMLHRAGNVIAGLRLARPGPLKPGEIAAAAGKARGKRRHRARRDTARAA